MPEVLPATTAAPAAWLTATPEDWWNVVRYGPPGFETYVRIGFGDPGPDEELGSESAVRSALDVLARFTSTPATAFVAIWEGCVGRAPLLDAPIVPIPNRTMLLFTGPVALMADAPGSTWGSQAVGIEPHLVWPRDRAWCLACEVDEELEFSVGCSAQAARTLLAVLGGTARVVPYGENAPLYRD